MQFSLSLPQSSSEGGGVGWAQTQGVVKYAKEYDSPVNVRDWLLSTGEDEDGNIISCGYSTIASPPSLDKVIPSIIRTDGKLDFLNHYRFMSDWDDDQESISKANLQVFRCSMK
jgi:hypothetical protein